MSLKLLSRGNAEEKIQALKQLKEVASRHHTLKRTLPKFLSDETPDVRMASVEMLIYYNQFLALDQVTKALDSEKNRAVQGLLRKAVEHLRTDRVN